MKSSHSAKGRKADVFDSIWLKGLILLYSSAIVFIGWYEIKKDHGGVFSLLNKQLASLDFTFPDKFTRKSNPKSTVLERKRVEKTLSSPQIIEISTENYPSVEEEPPVTSASTYFDSLHFDSLPGG